MKMYSAIVIGGSAGGIEALELILPAFSTRFALPVLIVLHLHPSDEGSTARLIGRDCVLPVVEPCDKEPIRGGRVFVAPANYHMLVEQGKTIALSVDRKVNWSRPSIDVLFESAVRVWRDRLVAVLLSGASADGARGIEAVKGSGGLTIAQDPGSARVPLMPQSAIDSDAVDEVLSPIEIGARIAVLGDGFSLHKPN